MPKSSLTETCSNLQYISGSNCAEKFVICKLGYVFIVIREVQWSLGTRRVINSHGIWGYKEKGMVLGMDVVDKIERASQLIPSFPDHIIQYDSTSCTDRSQRHWMEIWPLCCSRFKHKLQGGKNEKIISFSFVLSLPPYS